MRALGRIVYHHRLEIVHRTQIPLILKEAVVQDLPYAQIRQVAAPQVGRERKLVETQTHRREVEARVLAHLDLRDHLVVEVAGDVAEHVVAAAVHQPREAEEPEELVEEAAGAEQLGVAAGGEEGAEFLAQLLPIADLVARHFGQLGCELGGSLLQLLQLAFRVLLEVDEFVLELRVVLDGVVVIVELGVCFVLGTKLVICI